METVGRRWFSEPEPYPGCSALEEKEEEEIIQIIKCTVHYIVHLQCTFFSLSHTYEGKGFLRFSVCMGTKLDESSTGRVLGCGFHHVTAHSRLVCALKLADRLFNFQLFFFLAGVTRAY
jgi:hypothetical protein